MTKTKKLQRLDPVYHENRWWGRGSRRKLEEYIGELHLWEATSCCIWMNNVAQSWDQVVSKKPGKFLIVVVEMKDLCNGIAEILFFSGIVLVLITNMNPQ